ncbi:hypothetical protein CERSUDRAFT_98335 [Gelatoporia subvermispora B]|uniref:Uncharacterized protein n=1 Tax=Ceriporiopsis subvermispora (strain B) TaxID=914234 RepID=M2QNP9_CERS8|nr:hypothetical protein CERSUDRAFT_98335 [Gelatoporia subvermispora B]
MWPSPTSPTHFIPSAPEPHSQSVLQSPLPVDPYSGAHEQELSANDPGLMDPYGVPERPRAAYRQFDHQWVPGHALNYPVEPEANAADQSFPSGASNQARYPSPASSGASTPDACWSDCSSSPGDVDYQSGSANGVGGNATISPPMVVTDSTPSASIFREHARYPTAEWDPHVPNRQSKYGANTNQAQAYYDSSASYAPVEASAYNLYETTQTSLQAHVGVTGHYQPTPHAAGSHSQVSWSDSSREDTVLPEQQPIQEQEQGRLTFEAGSFTPGHGALVPLVVPPAGHWSMQGAPGPSQPWSEEHRRTEGNLTLVAPPHALESAWPMQNSATIPPMAVHGGVVNAGASGPLSTRQTGPKRRERQRKPKLPVDVPLQQHGHLLNAAAYEGLSTPHHQIQPHPLQYRMGEPRMLSDLLHLNAAPLHASQASIDWRNGWSHVQVKCEPVENNAACL